MGSMILLHRNFLFYQELWEATLFQGLIYPPDTNTVVTSSRAGLTDIFSKLFWCFQGDHRLYCYEMMNVQNFIDQHLAPTDLYKSIPAALFFALIMKDKVEIIILVFCLCNDNAF